MVSDDDAVRVVTIDRPHRRNAVDSASADALAATFAEFDGDDRLSVAVLTGAGGYFCAGADLKALATGDRRPVGDTGRGPMGPTRMRLSKPVIAAIEGHAVAGGLELALWCDLRVAASDAVLGVYCRRFGVPLVDLGTINLPRLIGHSRAIDLILTGRGIDGVEAERIGLVNRVTEPGGALAAAVMLGPRVGGAAAAVPAQRPPVGHRAVGPRSRCGDPQRIVARAATRSPAARRSPGRPASPRRRPRRDDRAPHAPMIAACSSVRSWLRIGCVSLGSSWVMNTIVVSSTGSTLKVVLAAPPQPYSPTL